VSPDLGPLPGGQKEIAHHLPLRGRGQGEGASQVGTQRAYFPATGEVTMPRHDRDTLAPGVVVTGPAVIEDEWSTIVVYPGQRAVADPHGHLVLDLEAVA
jgi:N-methylhydantoinase A/oxoprolinase/acetone carboxylase beta subunit